MELPGRKKNRDRRLTGVGACLLPYSTSGKSLSHSVPRFPYLSTRSLRMLTSWVSSRQAASSGQIPNA